MPTVVTGDPVRNAIDVHEQLGALLGDHDPVHAVSDLQAALVAAEALQLDIETRVGSSSRYERGPIWLTAMRWRTP